MLWKAQAIITIISFHLAIHWNSSFAVACYYWLIPHLLVHNNFILQFLNSLLLFHKVIISFNFHAIHSSINIWQSTNGVCFVRVASSNKSDSWQQLANKHTNYAYLTFWASIQSIYFCIASSFDMPTNSPNQNNNSTLQGIPSIPIRSLLSITTRKSNIQSTRRFQGQECCNLQ